MSYRSSRTEIRLPRTARLLAAIVAVLISFVVTSPVSPGQVAASHEDWAPPATVYFPETGHTLDRLFLDLWRDGGGAASYGYPITPEITLEDGHIIQYLQYARFEYWPNGDDNGVIVKLGDIGYDLRPILIPRGQFSQTGVSKQIPSAPEETARIALAWLPLDKEAADRRATDTWRYVPETGHSVQFGFKDFWERTGEAAYLGNPLTEEYVLRGITYQVFEHGQIAWQKGADPWLVPLGEVLARRYQFDTTAQARGDVPIYDAALFVPPPHTDATDAPPPPTTVGKSIVVSLSQQMMWAYDGPTVVLSSLVSTGRPGFDTPPGLFTIIVKKEVEDMEGLIGGEYYNVPSVPDVMYFTDVGHAIHGAYWHNNFGQVMSHGCVNLPLDVAAWLYDWTPYGTLVLIVP